MRHLSIAIMGLVVTAICGCESAAPPQAAERLDSAPAPPAPAAPAEPAPAEEPVEAKAQRDQAAIEAKAAELRALGVGVAPDGAPADAPPANTPPAAAPDAEAMPADAPAQDDELSKAQVGVGVKGKDYGGPGFVTTPIETMFTVEERIAFEIQIPNAMKIYKADHDSKGPKTHEEFMDIIIKENGVQLPELPPGNVYWYDANTEELMVRTPKPDANAGT
jgi:hypothetical protein